MDQKVSPTMGKFREEQRRKNMLYTLALILIVAWLLGLVTSYTIGGFIHILLVVAIILVLVRVIQGRKVL
jgi:hypothetical protein